MAGSLAGGALFVIGTMVGGGVLALPLSIFSAGFIPGTLVLGCVWAIMFYTSLLYLEIVLWNKDDQILMAITSKTFHAVGRRIIQLLYLYLLYALIVAFLAGGGELLDFFVRSVFEVQAPRALIVFGLTACLAALLGKDLRNLDLTNRFLSVALVIGILYLSFLKIFDASLANLAKADFQKTIGIIPISITAFGFQIVIPSLVKYYHRDARRAKIALCVGSLVPLLLYTLWNAAFLGGASILPSFPAGSGAFDVLDAMYAGAQGGSLSYLIRIVSFAALFTSLLGVALCLFDSVEDLLQAQGLKSAWLVKMCCLLPPFVVIVVNPSLFLVALDWAGTYGVLTLLVLLPCVTIWIGRYRLGLTSDYRAPGGKAVLALVIVLGLLIIAIESAHKLGAQW